MKDYTHLSARAIALGIAQREFTAEAVVQSLAERIASLDPEIRAWQHFDAAAAVAQAQALAQRTDPAPLLGVPVGVKDLIDTVDMPTTYGSPLYAQHRPQVDAASVASCRQLGAVIMGKTVTTEFATFQPGPTRNPKASARQARTPGGSSSGSAAAVAAGMVPVAFGTQTAGSIVRPAAYCGVVGYKPTQGWLPLAGVKSLAPSLDTLGLLTRSVDDAAFVTAALSGLKLSAECPARLRVGLCHTPHWERASSDARRALALAARLLEEGGASLTDVAHPAGWAGLTQAQIDIMGHEAHAAFAPERGSRPELFSAAFTELLAVGALVDAERLRAAHGLADQARSELAALFEEVDVLLAPSAEGEAPVGLAATGNPIFNRLWTLLGAPCVHVPLGVGAQGLPIGVTVIGPRWRDAQALGVAARLEQLAG